MWRCRARGRAGRSVGAQCPARGRGAAAGPCRRLRGVGGARGRERAGPTRSHPEPGRDPAQRRRVLWGRPHGRRGRRGHPPPSTRRGRQHRADGQDARRPIAESRSLIAESPSRGGAAAARWAHNPKVGGSNPPPLPDQKATEQLCSVAFCCAQQDLARYPNSPSCWTASWRRAAIMSVRTEIAGKNASNSAALSNRSRNRSATSRSRRRR